MKKQKWAVVFAALLAMVGFSSCLSSEDDGVRTLEDYAEVNSSSFGGLSFTSMYGWVCVPNKTVTSTPESKLAYIAYQYNNADMQALTSTSTNLPVTLLYDPVYLKDLSYPSSNLPLNTETVSIYSLGKNAGFVWGKNKYLVLAPTYLLKTGTTTDNLKTELANHSLSVYYLAEDDDVQAKTLTLHLRYKIAGVGYSSVEENSDTDESWAADYSVQYRYTDVSYVSLDYLLSQYKAVHGSDPEKIAVEYECSNRSTAVPTIANKQLKTVTFSLYKDTANQ